jgi:hypothetical protein
MLLLLLVSLTMSDVASAEANSDGGRAADPMRPIVRSPSPCEQDCLPWTPIPSTRFGIDGLGWDARPQERCRVRDASTRLSWCGLVSGPTGLTFLVFDARTGRTHTVRATVSRRGVRVTVRF